MGELMNRRIIRVQEDGDNITVSTKLEMTKGEYVEFRTGFLQNMNQLETQVKRLKGELVRLSDSSGEPPSGPLMSIPILEEMLEYIKNSRKIEELRGQVKEQEGILEIFGDSIKNLKLISI